MLTVSARSDPLGRPATTPFQFPRCSRGSRSTADRDSQQRDDAEPRAGSARAGCGRGQVREHGDQERDGHHCCRPGCAVRGSRTRRPPSRAGSGLPAAATVSGQPDARRRSARPSDAEPVGGAVEGRRSATARTTPAPNSGSPTSSLDRVAKRVCRSSRSGSSRGSPRSVLQRPRPDPLRAASALGGDQRHQRERRPAPARRARAGRHAWCADPRAATGPSRRAGTRRSSG